MERIKTIEANDLLAFWGKAGKGDTVHPALFHMIDVGQVTAVLLETVASRALVDFLAKPFAGDIDIVRRFVPFVAACHDIGKISPGFQNKRADLTNEIRTGGYPFSKGVPDVSDHCRVARQTLPTLFHTFDSLDDIAVRLADLLGAHHGRFLTPSSDGVAGCGREPWVNARKRAIAELGRLFGYEWSRFPDSVIALGSDWCMVVAGVVTVSDWIGSAQELFPYVNSKVVSIDEYTKESRRRAEAAVEILGCCVTRAVPG